LNALRSIIYGSCVYWNGLLSFTWPWSSLSLSWLVGVELPNVTEFWFYSLHIGAIKLRSLIFWKLVPHVYGLVFAQRRPSGSAGWVLNFQ